MTGRDTTCVFDASALLALLNNERGEEAARAVAHGAALSAVNWSETAQKLLERGFPLADTRTVINGLGIQIMDFGAEDGARAAELWPSTRSSGLSLGDRACLALGLRLNVEVVTADRTWSLLTLPVHVRVIR